MLAPSAVCIIPQPPPALCASGVRTTCPRTPIQLEATKTQPLTSAVQPPTAQEGPGKLTTDPDFTQYKLADDGTLQAITNTSDIVEHCLAVHDQAMLWRQGYIDAVSGAEVGPG